MSHETQLIEDAANKGAKKARKMAKEQNYRFIEFENGVLYKIVRGKKKKIKEISDYQKEKQIIKEDPRIAW